MTPKKSTNQIQNNFLYKDLLDQLDPKDPLMRLKNAIPWNKIETEFAKFYSIEGRPAKTIRLMVGLLLLKQIENLSDDRVVEEWKRNPYYQSFCGETHFQWKFPCEPSDLTHFRKRIGEEGAKRIFQISIDLHGKNAQEAEIVADTTVQEKNITFPTDTKLRLNVITRLWRLALNTGIKLRRSYAREVKTHTRTIRFNRDKTSPEYEDAKEKIKNIANALLREISRKLAEKLYLLHKEELLLYERAVNQKKDDKNKIYSLKEPQTVCIGKGKEHKKYEFGSKAAIAITKDGAIVVGAVNFEKNEYDGNTLPKLLEQVCENVGKAPKTAFCDRGFRGRKKVAATEIEIPGSPAEKTTAYFKRKAKRNFGRRSAVEAVIGHLKNDFRMARNYLKGSVGDAINLFLAASAFNMKKWMRLSAERLCFLFFALFLYLSNLLKRAENRLEN